MKIKNIDIDTHGKKPISVAYFDNKTLEIYFDGFTIIKKNYSHKKCEKLCEKMDIDWSYKI